MTSAGADTPLPWQDPAWFAEVTAWIDHRLAELDLARTGTIEQPHMYWWSTALRIPTSDGVVWFKATQPDSFEPRLTTLLAARAPHEIAEVMSTDEDRGWMLTRDAGARLRDLSDGPSLEHWEQLLPRYAQLQLDLAPDVDELLDLGVPDHRLHVLPDQLGRTLDEPELVLLGHADGLGDAEHARLRAGLPEFTDLCGRLAAVGVPQTLQHDDFNDGNVFVRAAQHVFFDWGDACLSHPFHTLVVTLRSLAYRYGLPPGGAEVQRLRDAYLEPWTSLASMDELVAAAELARQTGTVQRALAWARLLRSMPPALRGEYVESVPYGLRLYLLDGPFGSWDDGSF